MGWAPVAAEQRTLPCSVVVFFAVLLFILSFSIECLWTHGRAAVRLRSPAPAQSRCSLTTGQAGRLGGLAPQGAQGTAPEGPGGMEEGRPSFPCALLALLRWGMASWWAQGSLTRSRPKAWDRTISCSSFFLMYSADSTMPWVRGAEQDAERQPPGTSKTSDPQCVALPCLFPTLVLVTTRLQGLVDTQTSDEDTEAQSGCVRQKPCGLSSLRTPWGRLWAGREMGLRVAAGPQPSHTDPHLPAQTPTAGIYGRRGRRRGPGHPRQYLVAQPGAAVALHGEALSIACQVRQGVLGGEEQVRVQRGEGRAGRHPRAGEPQAAYLRGQGSPDTDHHLLLVMVHCHIEGGLIDLGSSSL